MRNRASLCSRVEHVIASASSAHRDRDAGQESLFDTMEIVSAAPSPSDGIGSAGSNAENRDSGMVQR